MNILLETFSCYSLIILVSGSRVASKYNFSFWFVASKPYHIFTIYFLSLILTYQRVMCKISEVNFHHTKLKSLQNPKWHTCGSSNLYLIFFWLPRRLKVLEPLGFGPRSKHRYMPLCLFCPPSATSLTMAYILI
jgi:hypothetical protein